MTAQKTIATLTGILTLLLALSAFVLSFNALTDLARQHGVSIPPLFPLTVEAAVIVFSLNALYRSLNGEPARVQWALIIFSSLMATVFNVAHSQTDWLSRLIAAMPSLFLLLSFESFLSLIRYQVTRQGLTVNVTELTRQAHELQQDVQRQAHERDRLQAHINELQAQEGVHLGELTPNDTDMSRANDARQAQIDERRQQVLTLLKEDVSYSDMADELGVSVATIKRDIKALNGRAK